MFTKLFMSNDRGGSRKVIGSKAKTTNSRLTLDAIVSSSSSCGKQQTVHQLFTGPFNIFGKGAYGYIVACSLDEQQVVVKIDHNLTFVLWEVVGTIECSI